LQPGRTRLSSRSRLFHASDRAEFAGVEAQDPVREDVEEAEVVAHDHNGGASVGECTKETQDAGGGDHVERGGGLVGQQEFGFGHERTGKGDALALAQR
jgi:hypothetical protein